MAEDALGTHTPGKFVGVTVDKDLEANPRTDADAKALRELNRSRTPPNR